MEKSVRIENLKSRIAECENSIKALDKMELIYEEEVTLSGGFYNEMIDVITEQKMEVQNSINNLQKLLKSEV